MIIGIVGNGFVGQATQLLKSSNINILIYDIDPDKCLPKNLQIQELSKCDLIFVCVPTPMNKDGSCYLNIVNQAINNLKNVVDLNKTDIILRSTVPPGISHDLDVFFMPEFLTEKNWKNDFKNCSDWIFGLRQDNNNNNFKNKVKNLINYAYKEKCINYNNIHFVDSKEAETIKYFRNVFLAVKVSFCNEIESFCSKSNINYNTIKDLACLDSRITDSHTTVPGPDGKRGFGGTCFPKDINSLNFEMKKIGIKPKILEAVIKRNSEIDRPNDDLEKGRAIV